MSQSQNPKDTQALLQSMLQRLKLQPGREGQAYLPAPAVSTWGQDVERGASNVQNVNNSPVNGFNGISSKEFAANFGLKGGETQQPGHNGGVISVPSQRDNIDGERGEDRVPEISPTGTGKLFPAQSRQDADITSFERTDGESFGSKSIKNNNNTATSMGQNQDQSFSPKVYTWASKPPDANLDSHIGNGVFAAQSKDVQVVSTNNSLRRKQQRASESKTRRWTQKIKDRWRDRPGSFGKKGKEEERRVEQKSEGADISPQNQPLTPENLNASNKEETRTLPSVDTPSTHTEDGSNEGCMRSTGDFDFGLGSFSLLDEIVTGQEWAKFLNPNQSASSTIQRPTELTIPTNPPESGQSPLILNQHGDANSQWNFRGTVTPVSDFSMAQISPDAFQPVSMDVTEGKQAAVREVHSDQSEPMEHGLTRRPHSFVKPTDMLENSEMKRASLNRKRQHERLHTESISNGKGEGSRLSLSPTNNHMMEETGASQHDNHMPLYTLKSPPPPLSPFTPFAPAPRGVLKHSISQDSHMSTEIVSKRRRLEENRHVHFSEEVVTIEPPEPYPDATDSEEEDSEEEEDSVIEYEEVQVGIEEVAAPAGRRAALPAWIQALKRKNTGRKPR